MTGSGPARCGVAPSCRGGAACLTSASRTAPPGPVPVTPARSTPSSAATRRARGVTGCLGASGGAARCRAAGSRSAVARLAGCCPAGRCSVCAAGGPAAEAARCTSARVIAPARPVPWIAARSTPSCLARCRTGGELAPRGCACSACRGRPRHALPCRRLPRWALPLGVLRDRGERGADRDGLACRDDQPLDGAGIERFDLYRRLRGVDNCDDVTLANLVTWLDQPFEQRALVHVGAEDGHDELGHLSPPSGARQQRSGLPAGAPPPPDAVGTASGPRRCTPVPPARQGRRTPAP